MLLNRGEKSKMNQKLPTIRKLIEPILVEMKLELYDLVFEKEADRNFLRVLIEREDWTMDIDTCVEVSEKISLLLDDVDYLEEEYILEVASPGCERELKNIEDYLKVVSKYILVETNKPVNKETIIKGYLKKISENSLTLQLNLKGRIKLVEIEFENIKKANLSFKY